MKKKISLRPVSYALGFLALSLAIIPVIPGLAMRTQLAIKAQRIAIDNEFKKASLNEDEELKRFQLLEQEKTLKTASDIGEHIQYKKIRIRDYKDNVNNPPKIDLSAFKDNENIQVFDKNGACIGRIRDKRFEWKRFYLNTCLEDNSQKKEK